MTAQEFNIRDRVQGASRHAVILKGDNGEQIFVMNRIFNAIMQDQSLQIRIVTIPDHERFKESKWLEAYIPTRM